MRKLTYLFLFVTSISLVSCLNDDESEHKSGMYGYYTVGPRNANGIYTLYGDFGCDIEPTPSSVYSLTQSDKGLENMERLFLSFYYYNKDAISIDGKLAKIVNADLQSGIKIPTANIYLDKEEADQELRTDTLTKVKGPHQVRSMETWATRGYLNLSITANHNGKKYPAANVYCDSIGSDYMRVKLIYNMHDSTAVGVDNFIYSYRLNSYSTFIPGSDSVKIEILADGIKNKILNVARRDMKRD